jgi:hypothetical protein
MLLRTLVLGRVMIAEEVLAEIAFGIPPHRVTVVPTTHNGVLSLAKALDRAHTAAAP